MVGRVNGWANWQGHRHEWRKCLKKLDSDVLWCQTTFNVVVVVLLNIVHWIETNCESMRVSIRSNNHKIPLNYHTFLIAFDMILIIFIFKLIILQEKNRWRDEKNTFSQPVLYKYKYFKRFVKTFVFHNCSSCLVNIFIIVHNIFYGINIIRHAMNVWWHLTW